MFLKLTEQFIKEHLDYKNDVDNFIRFLQDDEWDLTSVDKHERIIKGFRTDDIIKSLKHHVDLEKIRKQEPAKKYLVVIRQLFEFILDNVKYSNEDLRTEFYDGTYNRESEEFISKNKDLLPKESLPALSEDNVVKLIKWCDESIDKDFKRNLEEVSTCFKRVTACLCIKLMLATGIMYAEARKLPFNCLNTDESIITINSFNIDLPRKLSTQFRQYFNIRNNSNSLKSKFLFSNHDGGQWDKKTTDSGIPNFLQTAIGQSSVTSVIKYRIKQLIENDISDNIITRLTGASKEIIADCSYALSEEDCIDGDMYINSKLTKTKIFYLL